MAESDDSLLKEAREAFATATDAARHNHDTYLDDVRFAREENEYSQWDKADATSRQAAGRPMLTINKLPAFIRQVVNDARQNKPAIHVHPADSGADKETAKVINGLIRNIEYTSNADVAYDTATECAVTGGFGYLRVGLDYAYEDSFDMDLSIQRVANPLTILGDPNSTAADSSDWDVAFVTDRLTKSQFKAKYGKSRTIVDWDDTQAWSDADSWRVDNTVIVAEYWTREEYDKKISLFTDLRDGSMHTYDEKTLTEDEDIVALLQMGVLQHKQDRTAKCHKVKQRIMSGVEKLPNENEEWLGKYIPIIPVYGDDFDIEGKRYMRSLIHNAKDAQRMFNYWRTTSTELVALAPRVPYIGPVGVFDHDIDHWLTANTKNHPYLEYDSKGGSLPPPMRQPLDSGVAAGALQEALNASDDIKAIIGLYDASLGAKSNETSGKAIMARQREGDVSTFHFMDNMARAIRHTGRILIDLIPKVYNGPRIIRVMGEDRSEKAVHINQEAPETDKKGNEIQDEMGQAVMRMHDLTAGKYDLTVTTGPSFTTRREEAAYQMTEIIRAFPDSAQIIAPELAKNLDWPGADEIAEKFEQQASGQLPEQAQKQMDELLQKVQQLTEENQNLKMDNQADVMKAKSADEINKAKTASDIRVAEYKAAKEIEIKQATAALDVKMKREELGANVEMGREKVRGDHALKSEQNQLVQADGERKKEADTVAAKQFERISKALTKMGEKFDARLDRLEQRVGGANSGA